jgi:signal transduction histidine kinase
MMSPRSMRFQTSAIIVVAFLLSHLAGFVIYTIDRKDALRMTEAIDLAERAAGVSRLLRDLPENARDDTVRFSDSRAFRVWTSPQSAFSMIDPSTDERDVLAYLRSQVPRIQNHEMRVRLLEDARSVQAPPFDPTNRVGSPPTAFDDVEQGPSLGIAIRHAEGEWLNFLGALSTPPSLLPELFVANAMSAIVGLALVAFWLVKRVTTPLAELAQAAERLGRNLFSEPLPEKGPEEVAVAARAFNRMQKRLVELIRNRTELLATISHDLRTPLTQVRLRLEMMPPSKERDRSLKSLDDVTETIGTFLSYAGAAHGSEEITRVDLGTLVASICDDLADCGDPVSYTVEDGVLVRCKRLAMKRAVTNLIDNAVRHGGCARINVEREKGMAVVRVDDDGPGVPEPEMEAVFRPFYRCGARSKTGGGTGGTGLGLAIAQAVAEDHGGAIKISNRADSGFRAELLIPVDGGKTSNNRGLK